MIYSLDSQYVKFINRARLHLTESEIMKKIPNNKNS